MNQTTSKEPIGGFYGKLAASQAATAMTQGAIGTTAGDVVNQSEQVPVSSSFEYANRGVVGNTLRKYLDGYQKQTEFRKQIKLFEDLMSQQAGGAKAAYDDAVKAYGEEIKSWIPVPELFVDEQTGAFMPYKYYQSYAEGIKQYKKSKQDEANQKLQMEKEENQRLYQKNMLTQGQVRLDQGAAGLRIQQQNANTSEANAIVGAERERRQGEKDKETEKRNQDKDMRAALNQSERNIISFNAKKIQAMSVGDQEGALEADKNLKAERRLHDSTLQDYMRMQAEEAGQELDDKTIKVAIDIQNSVDGIMDGDEFQKKYGFATWQPKSGAIGESGQPVEPTNSDLAQYVLAYAQSIGARDAKGNELNPQLIESWLGSTSLPMVLQAIVNIAGRKKKTDTTGIGQ